MSSLGLPLPVLYCAEDGDLYPHRVKMTVATYRTPWRRGTVVSTCKLFVSGSMQDDLGQISQPVNFVEKLSITADQMIEDLVDMVPSSNPNSQVDLNENEAVCLLQESEGKDHCKESFYKIIPDPMGHGNQNEDLLLPEEVLLFDYLTRYKRRLPTLTAKLVRLRNLPVSDPLLSSTAGMLSEDTIFRHCAPFTIPPDVCNTSVQSCSILHEVFDKETVLNEESLMLPFELETLTLNREDYTRFPIILRVMNVAPEPTEEQIPVLNVIRKAAFLAEDISQFELPVGTTADCRMNGGPAGQQSAEHLVLPTELELALALSPIQRTRLTQPCCSLSQLHVEQLSPVHRRLIVSERDQRDMELALWKAEKHRCCMLGFLLTEPRTCEPAVEFQPLSEALRILKIDHENVISAGDSISDKLQSWMPAGVPDVYFSSSHEFTESLACESSSAKQDKVEDFTIISPSSIESVAVSEVIIPPVLKSPSQPTQPSQLQISGNAFTPKAVSKNQSPGNTIQRSLQTHNINAITEKEKAGASVFSAPAGTTHNEKETTGWNHTLGETISPNIKVTFNPRAILVGECRPEQRASDSQQALIQHRPDVRDCLRGLPSTGLPPERKLDPLSTFMKLRRHQRSPDTAALQNCTSSPATKVKQQMPQPASQPILEQKAGLDSRPTHMSGVVVSENVIRAQETDGQSVKHSVCQTVSESRQGNRVVQVQATESQWHAYCELLAFAQPCMSKARELGLSSSALADFSSLAPDQTQFLLKQQGLALKRVSGQDQELRFNQAALMHVLVTVKDLLLKCDLKTAVEYLARAADTCVGQSLELLVRRLQILLYISQKSQEPDPKLLELQDQLVTWQQTKEGNALDKALVILTVDSDRVRNVLIKSLSQATGQPVTAVCPEKGRAKLNGARMLNSLCDSQCVVVCGQHVGPDFPWQCFSLVVEYQHSFYSPWAVVCGEKSISRLCFITSLPISEENDTAYWSLEDNIPYVLFVTQGLLNLPLLLQILESTYNMTVLERDHPPSLQMLGGTHHYAVVTVDASTAVIIQEQKELCNERASEDVVMRLNALSQQYSSCWFILYCPESSEGGLIGDAFCNLELVYSSLVLKMKAKDLAVKVLIESEVVEVARWISRICFNSLMTSDIEPFSYLDRDWLAVMPSEDDKRLLRFPCLNPLVIQLMIKRAPSLLWLLGASLSQLEELLPEVPHKVLKLFNDISCLYKPTADPSSPEPLTSPTQQTQRPLNQPPTTGGDPQPDPFFTDHATSCLPLSPRVEGDPERAKQGGSADFQVNLRCSSTGPHSHFQNYLTNSDLCGEERGEREEVEFHGRSSQRMGVAGRIVVRGREEEWIQTYPINRHLPTQPPHSTDEDLFQCEPVFDFGASLLQPACEKNNPTFSHTTAYSDHTQPDSHNMTPAWLSPTSMVPLGGGQDGASWTIITGTTSAYGSKSRMGREMKRSADAAGMASTVLPPVKKTRLSYEPVPGRRDGQTRLGFF
ncbi:protein shortage in chiasmata 1 ortholog [Lampris incognitus]|uniref:protein shortage in chiasmata 1 ortholog n=1 Tax=Lampris incognitus TaxID=2546036 RepID=UPI0024B498EB|nr:protein shortage in chiasmata 1 ortholog [Lampris incognitus]